MRRRDFLLLSGAVVSGHISTALADVILSGRITSDGLNESFSSSHRGVVERVADLLIPDTETPGSVATGGPAFVELMVFGWLGESDRAKFIAGLDDLNRRSREACAIDFDAAPETVCLQILQELDAKQIAQFYNPARPIPFFARFKELVVAGYFTTEIGATKALRYAPAPGKYEADIEIHTDERAWFYGSLYRDSAS